MGPHVRQSPLDLCRVHRFRFGCALLCVIAAGEGEAREFVELDSRAETPMWHDRASLTAALKQHMTAPGTEIFRVCRAT